MKKLLSLVLICLLAIPAFACAQVFEAASAGFGGEVKADELCLPVSAGGVLPCGTSGRWEKK